MARPTKEFKDTILQPTLKDFSERYDQLHVAFAAVAAVDAYAAHIFYEAKDMGVDVLAELGFDPSERGRNDDSWFRSEIAKRNREFRVLRDVAKANKHAFLTQHQPIVNGSADTQLEARPFGMGAYGEGRFGGVPEVVIKTLEENTYLAEELLRKSVECLDDLARQLEIPI